MNVREAIEALSKLDPETRIMFWSRKNPEYLTPDVQIVPTLTRLSAFGPHGTYRQALTERVDDVFSDTPKESVIISGI